ncbi:PAP2 family protein [Streptomyces carminius]|uniref:PAP2 family protein n=1 Tax=Streptomyces carminius TaxID=2665496 RepID=A0A2M8LPR8_9ACTN|nr:phosphatase PAP2 family protein [Streptomyces carminius]PJE93963.1 PAP2 family protein [Streptomyces carminius]
MPGRLERFAGREALAWGVTLLAGTGFALLLVLVRTRWEPLRNADRAVADALNGLFAGNRVGVGALRVLTDLGGTPIMLWLLGVGVLWFLIRRQWWIALYAAVAALGGMGLNALVKVLVGRLRPVVDVPLSEQSGMSFPSGHALGSTVTYGVLLLVFLPVVRPRLRPWFAAVMVLAVLTVGFTRMALGVHYLSDVLAGWLLGVVWLALSAVAFRQWRWGSPPWRRGQPPLSAGLDPAPEDGLRPVPRQHAPALPRPALAAVELLVVWVLIAGLLHGLGLLLRGAGPGARPAGWDSAAVRWAVEQRGPWLDDAAAVVEVVGGTPGIVTGALVIGPLGVAVARSWRPLVLLALGLAGELTLYLVTTLALPRERPDVPQLNPDLRPAASFPSGHVAAATVLVLCTAVVVFRATRNRWWRLAAVVPVVLVPPAVGFQRLYAGVHHLSDVLAGVLLAGCWVAVCWWVTRLPRGEEQPPPSPADADSGGRLRPGPEPEPEPGGGHVYGAGLRRGRGHDGAAPRPRRGP